MAYERPTKKCDLVMKGGVTSGVVYPKAIGELSKQYQFSSIGGTSAGAIAAAVAAAAEYARAGDKLDAFEDVARLPDWLCATSPDKRPSNLFHLFQPQLSLAPLYAVLTAGLGKKWIAQCFAKFRAALLQFPVAASIGLLPGALVAWVASGTEEWQKWLGFALAGVIGLLLCILVAAVWLARQIPHHGWGLCFGMTETKSAGSPALVPWLSEYLDRLAGKNSDEPLAFGDLESRNVHLQMISTNLTNGRPYSLPFSEHTHFYFKGSEFGNFFPESVVRWMETHPGQPPSRGPVKNDGLSILPDRENLPVIVAGRMSLSFPFLFCPVPFYGVDFGYGPKTTGQSAQSIPEPCFFVDGGLANNFPLNLFDKPLPRWPTFGINLRSKDERHRQDAFIPCDNSGGLEGWWTGFEEKYGLGGLLGYFGLLFDTSRNWRDNLQMSAPGYRDRVVHIGLDPEKEGGMNLDMPGTVINDLTKRGQQAGRALLSRYSPTDDYPILRNASLVSTTRNGCGSAASWSCSKIPCSRWKPPSLTLALESGPTRTCSNTLTSWAIP